MGDGGLGAPGLGELPAGWAMAFDAEQRPYYINYNLDPPSTSYEHPVAGAAVDQLLMFLGGQPLDPMERQELEAEYDDIRRLAVLVRCLACIDFVFSMLRRKYLRLRSLNLVVVRESGSIILLFISPGRRLLPYLFSYLQRKNTSRAPFSSLQARCASSSTSSSSVFVIILVRSAYQLQVGIGNTRLGATLWHVWRFTVQVVVDDDLL
jgi:hypothetical protein